MPTKYLNKQNRKPEPVTLSAAFPSSISNTQKFPNNTSSPQLAPNVQTYLASLEKKLHEQQRQIVSESNSDKPADKKKQLTLDPVSRNIDKKKFVPSVLNNTKQLLSWSDISISSELAEPTVHEPKSGKIQPTVMQSVDDDSIDSSIINVKSLSDLSIATELHIETKKTNKPLNPKKFQPTNRRVSSATNLESSLPPKSPFKPFSFKLPSTVSSVNTVAAESESSSKISSHYNNDDSSTSTDIPTVNESESNSHQSESTVELSKKTENYETDEFETDESESGYEKSDDSENRNFNTLSSSGLKNSISVSSAMKSTQTDAYANFSQLPYAVQYGALTTVPFSNPFYNAAFLPHSQPMTPELSELLRVSIRTNLSCIKSYANLQYDFYQQWNDLLKRQKRQFATIKEKPNKNEEKTEQ